MRVRDALAGRRQDVGGVAGGVIVGEERQSRRCLGSEPAVMNHLQDCSDRIENGTSRILAQSRFRLLCTV